MKERLTPIARLELNSLLDLKRADIKGMKTTDAADAEGGRLRLQYSITGTSAITAMSPKFGHILLMRRSFRNTPRWKCR